MFLFNNKFYISFLSKITLKFDKSFILEANLDSQDQSLLSTNMAEEGGIKVYHSCQESPNFEPLEIAASED